MVRTNYNCLNWNDFAKNLGKKLKSGNPIDDSRKELQKWATSNKNYKFLSSTEIKRQKNLIVSK